MSVVWNGSVDAGKLVPPWQSIQDYDRVRGITPDTRITVAAAPAIAPDGHKWVQIECHPGDHLVAGQTKERAQLSTNAVRVTQGQRRYVAWRTFFEAYTQPPTSPQPKFNVTFQLLAATVGQSPVLLQYDCAQSQFNVQIAGGKLQTQGKPTYTQRPFLHGFHPEGHLLDLCLVIVPDPAKGYLKLIGSVDGGPPQVFVTPAQVPTMYTDLVGLWPAHCIYREGRPEIDRILVRPMILADSYSDARSYFGGGWPSIEP